LISQSTLTVNATLDVSGGATPNSGTQGGAGSGGGLLLAGRAVDIRNATLDARGGVGGTGGGGGSGGRIAIYANRLLDTGATVLYSGGDGGDSRDGESGTYNVATNGYPEPFPHPLNPGTVIVLQ
jgi:hypothetical protein